MPVWSSDPDTASTAIDAIHAGLTVRLIMTERRRLMTCRPCDSVAALKEKNTSEFSRLPVVKDEQICGLFDAEPWFEGEPSATAQVGEDFEPLSEDALIGGDAPILEFVCAADMNPTRLVVSGGRIVGLVCLADLQKLPVRTALFSVVTALEIAMADRIQAEWPEGGWRTHLSCGRQRLLEKTIQNLESHGNFVSDILATQFCDKRDVVVGGRLLARSKGSVENDLKRIERLRDALAHANVFAEERESAERLPCTVRKALDYIKQLRSDSGK